MCVLKIKINFVSAKFLFFFFNIVERDSKKSFYTLDLIHDIQKKVSGFCNIFDENSNFIYYNKNKKIIEWKDLSYVNKNNYEFFIFSIKLENDYFLIHTYTNERMVFSYSNDLTKLEVAEYILFLFFFFCFQPSL